MRTSPSLSGAGVTSSTRTSSLPYKTAAFIRLVYGDKVGLAEADFGGSRFNICSRRGNQAEMTVAAQGFRLSMNRGLEEAAGWFVNGGLADAPFPLTPTLSLGEREHRSNSRLRMRFIVPMRVEKRPACQ